MGCSGVAMSHEMSPENLRSWAPCGQQQAEPRLSAGAKAYQLRGPHPIQSFFFTVAGWRGAVRKMAVCVSASWVPAWQYGAIRSVAKES